MSCADRAFADAMIRMRFARGEHELEGELEAVRAAATLAHAELRATIAEGRLRDAALRAHFDSVPALERDHYVEEVLGIAYPPLDEPPAEPELIAYTPSGYDEIVHAFDVTGLSASDRLLDIGAGMGKVVLLASLLTGATGEGIERTAPLTMLAEEQARLLRVDARFSTSDAREVALPASDVVFMYLPFTGTALANVMHRLPRGRFLCAGSLDLARYPALVPVGEAKSWLRVYRWG